MCITNGLRGFGEILLLAASVYFTPILEFLDATNVLDLFSLHFVYLPYINY